MMRYLIPRIKKMDEFISNVDIKKARTLMFPRVIKNARRYVLKKLFYELNINKIKKTVDSFNQHVYTLTRTKNGTFEK